MRPHQRNLTLAGYPRKRRPRARRERCATHDERPSWYRRQEADLPWLIRGRVSASRIADVARKIAITVHPSGAVSDSLTVADAMRQVLDIFEALERIDDASGDLDEAEANPTLARSEFGAREGELAGVTKYHNAPALIVRDRITGDRFTAVLKPDLAKRLGPLHSWGEAWDGRRIVVTGTLHFDGAGIVRRADAEDLEAVTPAVVTLADLEGIDLLGGKSVSEHLALIWERNG